jgi:hypothetical protein
MAKDWKQLASKYKNQTKTNEEKIENKWDTMASKYKAKKEEPVTPMYDDYTSILSKYYEPEKTVEQPVEQDYTAILSKYYEPDRSDDIFADYKKSKKLVESIENKPNLLLQTIKPFVQPFIKEKTFSIEELRSVKAKGEYYSYFEKEGATPAEIRFWSKQATAKGKDPTEHLIYKTSAKKYFRKRQSFDSYGEVNTFKNKTESEKEIEFDNYSKLIEDLTNKYDFAYAKNVTKAAQEINAKYKANEIDLGTATFLFSELGILDKNDPNDKEWIKQLLKVQDSKDDVLKIEITPKGRIPFTETYYDKFSNKIYLKRENALTEIIGDLISKQISQQLTGPISGIQQMAATSLKQIRESADFRLASTDARKWLENENYDGALKEFQKFRNKQKSEIKTAFERGYVGDPYTQLKDVVPELEGFIKKHPIIGGALNLVFDSATDPTTYIGVGAGAKGLSVVDDILKAANIGAKRRLLTTTTLAAVMGGAQTQIYITPALARGDIGVKEKNQIKDFATGIGTTLGGVLNLGAKAVPKIKQKIVGKPELPKVKLEPKGKIPISRKGIPQKVVGEVKAPTKTPTKTLLKPVVKKTEPVRPTTPLTPKKVVTQAPMVPGVNLKPKKGIKSPIKTVPRETIKKIKTEPRKIYEVPEDVKVKTDLKTKRKTYELPENIERLESIKKDMEVKKEKGFRIDLQLFAAVEKKINEIKKTTSKFYDTTQKSEFISEEVATQIKPEDMQYTKESLDKVIKQIDTEIKDKNIYKVLEELKGKDNWNKYDVVKSARAAEILIETTKDFEAAKNLLLEVRPKATESGRTVNAFKAYRKTTAGRIKEAQKAAEKQIKTSQKSKMGESETVLKTKGQEAIKKTAKDVGEFADKNLLVRKIKGYIKDQKLPFGSTEKIIANELFNIAKESPLIQGRKFKKQTTLENVVEVLSNKDEARKVFDEAKVILREKYKDKPQVMERLENFWSKEIEPYISKATTTKVLKEELKSLGIKLENVVLDWYGSKNKTIQSLSDSLESKLNISKEDAKMFSDLVFKQFKEEIGKVKAKQIKKKIMKPRETEKLTVTDKAFKDIKEIANLGMQETKQINLSTRKRLRNNLKKILDRSGLNIKKSLMDLNKLEVEAKMKYLEELGDNLNIKSDDLKEILNVALEVFDEAVYKAKAQELKRTLKLNKKDFFKNSKKEAMQEIKLLSNLDAFKIRQLQSKTFEKVEEMLRREFKEKTGLPFSTNAKKKITNQLEKVDTLKLLQDTRRLNEFEKVKYMWEFADKLDINSNDLRKVLQIAEKTFNDIIANAKEKEFKKLFKAKQEAKVQKKKTEQKILDGVFLNDDVKLSQGLKEYYGLADLTTKDMKEIAIYAKGLREIDDQKQLLKSESLLKPNKEQLSKYFELEYAEATHLAGITNVVARASRVEDVLSKLEIMQTMAQLLNFKTIGRNVIANELFYRIGRMTKVVGSLIDLGYSTVTGKSRKLTTKGAKYNKEFIKDLIRGGKASLEGKSLRGQETKFDFKRQVFKNKKNPLHYAEKLLDLSLSPADYAAYQRAFKEVAIESGFLDGMNQGLKGKALEDHMIKFVIGMDDVTREIAEKAGNYYTFQDKNVVSKALSKFKRWLNRGKDFGIGSQIIKYPQVPGALIMRSIEFSPFGIFDSVSKLTDIMINKNLSKFTRRDVIESMSRVIVGTGGLSALGYFMAENNLITAPTAGKDYEQTKLEQEAGGGKYQINWSGIKRWVSSGFDKNSAKWQKGDKLYSYDWAQPLASGITLGVGFNYRMNEKVDNANVPLSALQSVLGGIETITEQPVLTGIERIMTKYPNEEFGDYAARVFTQSVSEIPASFVPTFLNQTKTYIDSASRETYDPNLVKQSLNKVLNKIPGLSQNLPQRYTSLGKPKTISPKGEINFFEAFMSPAFIDKYNPSPEAQMLIDLYNETKEGRVGARTPRKYVVYTEKNEKGKKVNKTRNLTAEEYVFAQQNTGSYIAEKLGESKNIKKLQDPNYDPDDKVKLVTDIFSDATKDTNKKLKQKWGVIK